MNIRKLSVLVQSYFIDRWDWKKFLSLTSLCYLPHPSRFPGVIEWFGNLSETLNCFIRELEPIHPPPPTHTHVLLKIPVSTSETEFIYLIGNSFCHLLLSYRQVLHKVLWFKELKTILIFSFFCNVANLWDNYLKKKTYKNVK